MIHGLLWFPLLGIFFWLAWAGWNDFQKVEAYRQWAKNFQRAKYDLYAVLGWDGQQLLWGKPTRQGILELQTLPLAKIKSIGLLIDHQTRSLPEAQQLLQQGKPPQRIDLQLGYCPPPNDGSQPEVTTTWKTIPFTDLALALEWAEWLQGKV